MSTNTLLSGASLTSNESLNSNNGTYVLTVAANGLMFLDNVVTGARLFLQGIRLKVNPVLTMQTDGNLVFREGNPSVVEWASGTEYINAYAVLCNNGNLVIYDQSGDPVWSSGTAQSAVARVFRGGPDAVTT